jgi:hypothetical protein
MRTILPPRTRRVLTAFGLFALVACGAADRVPSPEETRSTTQALSGPATYTFQVTLPTGASIAGTTVGAASSVLIGSRAVVYGPAAAGSVEVQPQGTTSTVTAVGNVALDNYATVNGSVSAGGTITAAQGVVVKGQQTPGSGATPGSITWSVTSPGNSQGPITLQNQAVGAPAPGVYDNVVVNGGSSLYVSTGTYFLQSLDLESGAKLVVDSREGPVFLYLAQAITFRGAESAVDSGIPRLFVGYFGTNQAILEAPFMGIFLAPQATVHLQNAQAAPNIATFYGQSFIAEPAEIIQPMPFDWSEVPGFPTPSGGWATIPPFGPPSSGGAAPTILSNAPPRVRLHTSIGATGAGNSTATASPSSPVPFTLTPQFDIGGEIANGTVVLTFTSPSGTPVTCTFQGGASSATPSTVLDLEAGRLLNFQSCTDGLPANVQRLGTNFGLTVHPVAGWPVSIDMPLDDQACDASFEMMTGLKTRQLHDSFSWSNQRDVGTSNPDELLPGTNTPSPALYYAWVYVHNDADMLNLEKLWVHVLTRPLFTQEIEPYAGRCGTFRNPGDGTGMFVPVLIPGKSYNALVDVHQQGNITGSPNVFDAVILRTAEVPAGARNANGSVKLAVLGQSHFHYLDYLPQPLPAQTALTLNGGAVATAIDAFQWVADAVTDVGVAITQAIGAFDALIANRVSFDIYLHPQNPDTNFDVPAIGAEMVEGWGTYEGQALGLGGVKVSLWEKTLGFIPESFDGTTDDRGYTLVRPAQHDNNYVLGSGICIKNTNDAARLTDFLVTNETCSFTGWDRNSGNGSSYDNPSFTIDSFNYDHNIDLLIADTNLSMLTELTDAWRYARDVIGYKPTGARALVGTWASVLSPGGLPFTMCFHLQNTDGNTILNTVEGFYNAEKFPPSYLNTTGVDALSLLAGLFSNNDIILDTDHVWNFREVGEHEYGHYILCNFNHDADNHANIPDFDGQILNAIISAGMQLDRTEPTTYINEAFADFISGQTTGIADYSWLKQQPGPDADDNIKVCAAPADSKSGVLTACYDANLNGVATDPTDDSSVGRISSLIHDAFDGQSGKGSNVPNDADPWQWSGSARNYSYTATDWGSFDSSNDALPYEQVALPGSAVHEFGDHMGHCRGPTTYWSDGCVISSLDATMQSHGYNWCQRCTVFALHSPSKVLVGGSDPPLQPLLQTCVTDTTISNTVGSPPEPNLRLDGQTCQPCPDGYTSNADAVCVPCPYTVIGNQCVQCTADEVIDGSAAALQRYSWPSTTSAPNDTCPNTFVLQVNLPADFFTRGATSLQASLSGDNTLTQSACQTRYDLVYNPLEGVTAGN